MNYTHIKPGAGGVLPRVKTSVRRIRNAWQVVRPPAAMRERQRVMRHFYSQFVSPGDLCFDVGANLGNRTRVLSDIGARVIAVEPQAYCARLLKLGFLFNRRVEVVKVALDATEGEREMMIADSNTLSSLSLGWVEAVQASGRFPGVSWRTNETVKTVTLDSLVRAYGSPSFVKIDVEGHEASVLEGLSSALPCLSLEFTPEYSAGTNACIDRLAELGMGSFNYSLGECMEMALKEWVGPAELKRSLAQFAGDPVAFGDIYSVIEQSRA